MTTLTFTYEGDETLSIKSDHGVKVEIVFDRSGPYPCVVRLDGDDRKEFDASDDVLNGLFVTRNGSPLCLQTIVTQADIQFEDIMEEVLEEDEAEDNYRRDVSSPYWSGRI